MVLAEELDAKICALCWNMNQGRTRQFAKTLIKAFEPKKQMKYLYNGGEYEEEASRLYDDPGALTKSPWWPEEGRRHRGESSKEVWEEPSLAHCIGGKRSIKQQSG